MKIGPAEYTGNLDWLAASTILLTRHGSHAYGLNTPTSDLDIKGVAVPPVRYFLGTERFEQAEFKDPEQNAEAVIYELRKFCKLAADCNPNIIEVLWTDPADHLLVTPAGQALVDHRDMFLSTKARHTFSGYAHAQLKRIKLHYGWHKRGETMREPTRKEYGLPEKSEIPGDQLAAALAIVQKKLDQWNLKDIEFLEPAARIAVCNTFESILVEMKLGDELWRNASGLLGYGANFLEYLAQEKAYRAAKAEWNAYLTWRNERNKVRADLESRHGYDTKHAMHLVRLLRMCGELLTTGKVIVKRPDRDELLAIRNGAWSYERLIEYAETTDRDMDALYKTTPLPHRVDLRAIDDLCIGIAQTTLADVRGER